MSQQTSPGAEGFFINVRKLAALDIVLHGPVLILGEFALAVLVSAALAAVLLYLGLFHGPAHSPYQIIAGVAFLCAALNYLPLLLYALDIIRRKSARAETTREMAHADQFTRKYGLQSLLLFLPLVIPVLAIVQELHQRRQSEAPNATPDRA